MKIEKFEARISKSETISNDKDIKIIQTGIPIILSNLKMAPFVSSIYNLDGLVKRLKTSFDVIPAKAGIQCFQVVLGACLRRHDGISDFLRVCQF
jgi:hypothetical protein